MAKLIRLNLEDRAHRGLARVLIPYTCYRTEVSGICHKYLLLPISSTTDCRDMFLISKHPILTEDKYKFLLFYL